MSKKIKPSLKGYLKAVTPPAVEEPAGQAELPSAEGAPPSDAFLALLTPQDQAMWGTMLAAGPRVSFRQFDAAAMRDEFQTLDKSRFTFYLLSEKGERLAAVRLGSQIRGGLSLLLKWDENGELTVYGPDAFS